MGVETIQAVSFTVEGEPVSKSRARVTRSGHAYTPKKTRDAEAVIAWEYRRATASPPDPDGLYSVTALFVSKQRYRRDVDNMLKLVLDGLNKTAWEDDSQVVEVTARKRFAGGVGDAARTEVTVVRVG